MSETFNIAVVGSGPAGFYAAEALLQSGLQIRVDMIERLPVPFGLVRHGVAPDHQRLKVVTTLFETIAGDQRFSFLGNLHLGRDIDISELREVYDGVIIATGALSDRPLGIDGEELQGSVSATEFVGWYNGHPDFRDKQFDLSHPNAVVVGNGNVALDVCRILSKSVEELRKSDICEHALDALATSKVENIFLVGRRGPAQAKFTTKELREFGELDEAQAVVDPADLEMNEASIAELAGPDGSGAAKNVKMFAAFAQATCQQKPKKIHFRFLLSPREIQGAGKVEAVNFDKVRLVGEAFSQGVELTGETVSIPAGLLVRSVGYRGTPIPGIPFDPRSGTIPNKDGRVRDDDGAIVPRLYVAGWIKRGPSGVIGTNRACGVDTANALLADLAWAGHNTGGREITNRDRFLRSLLERPLKIVDFDGWRRIDALEKAAGAASGKPREKMTRVQAMLDASRNECPLFHAV